MARQSGAAELARDRAADPAGIPELLAELYAGISDEQPWRRFLEALSLWMSATFATLIITEPEKTEPATFLTPGGSPRIAGDYAASLFADDPFRGLPDGKVMSYAEFMAGLPETAHADYRSAMSGIGFTKVLGIDLHFGGSGRGTSGDARYEARFRVSRHDSLPDFSREDRARLQSLARHLRIAVGLFARLQFADAQHGVFHATAQGLGLALVVVDRGRRIVSTNALANDLLAENEGLLRRGEELVFGDPAHQRTVTELLEGGGEARLAKFRVRRPRFGDLAVTARPLSVEAIHKGPGALALFLARPGTETRADPDALRDLLGLSKAESRLAATLAEGLGLGEAAARLGVSRNTAKVQLRAIFDKTGVRRQAQLVALLASLGE